jgi:SAM-dependent methyltransferase
MHQSTKDHWERIYGKKRPDEVSWYQENPKTSFGLIHSLHLPMSARIIDVGGGDSMLVDALLAEGFQNITVLDISGAAIARAKERLGDRAGIVQWVVNDIAEYVPEGHFDLWHDRATYHFLNDAEMVGRYVATATQAIREGGFGIVATFSTSGPRSCSGLPVHQYDEETLPAAFGKGFEKIGCVREDHITPAGAKQNFLFCTLRRIPLPD